VIVPNVLGYTGVVVPVLFHPVPGAPIVTLFQTFRQSASKTRVPMSLGSGKLRRREASRFVCQDCAG